MLVLLVAASGYLFELTEGFDSLEGIGLLEENIGGLGHCIFTHCNRNYGYLPVFNLTYTDFDFVRNLGHHLLYNFGFDVALGSGQFFFYDFSCHLCARL